MKAMLSKASAAAVAIDLANGGAAEFIQKITLTADGVAEYLESLVSETEEEDHDHTEEDI
jgi:hypothetical protein